MTAEVAQSVPLAYLKYYKWSPKVKVKMDKVLLSTQSRFIMFRNKDSKLARCKVDLALSIIRNMSPS